MTRDQLKYNCSRWHHEIISLMSLCALSSDKDARIKEDDDIPNTNEVHREIKLTVYNLCYKFQVISYDCFVLFNQNTFHYSRTST